MIKENLSEIKERIQKACVRSGREPESVTLIAVSKTKPISMLMEAYDAGVRDFGENKVQEILEKAPLMPEDCRFHMIGHLQTNKVRQVLGLASLIHSVDSLHLAEKIDSEAKRRGMTAQILLEVNAAREESKYGFLPEELMEALEEIGSYSHICVKGLMTIAPNVENAEDNRKVFRDLYQLYVDIKSKNIDNVSMSILSMGMTGDFETAIEEGAAMIRVGTGIFGSR